MKEVELGEFEGRMKLGGQYVLEFEKWYYFPLKSGLYYKAGQMHGWTGNPKGIGLNPYVSKFLENLVIDNRRTENCYVLNDLDKAKNLCGQETQRGKRLFVFPLFCFEEIEIKDRENIPNNFLGNIYK